MEQEMRMRFRVLGKAPNRIVALLVQAAVIAALIGIGVPPARAQLAGAGPGWQVLVNPYLWIPGVSAKIQTPLPQRPEVDTNVSFDRILAKLNGVPFEGAAELRYGPFSLLGDFIHLPVAANIPTRDVFFHDLVLSGVGLARAVHRCGRRRPSLGLLRNDDAESRVAIPKDYHSGC